MVKKKQIKNDTYENWSKATFIPKKGEIILYTDLLKIKIGDGVHPLDKLEFINGPIKMFNGDFNY